MSDLEKKISDLLTAALDGIANTPDEIAVKVVQFLNDEYDRQIDAALEEIRL